MLWSDPIGPNIDDEELEGAKRETITYVANWDRGAGQFYGISAVRDFVLRNKFDGIIRAHEVNDDDDNEASDDNVGTKRSQGSPHDPLAPRRADLVSYLALADGGWRLLPLPRPVVQVPSGACLRVRAPG